MDIVMKGLLPAIKEGDLAKVKEIYEHCYPLNLAFILNEEEELELPGEYDLESMLDWSLINVAAAKNQNKVL
jgi:hypothetical protein